VEHYARGGDDRSNISADMKPLKLSEQEKNELVAFLHALTGRRPPVTTPLLPQ
jgi:cytochrome c peroxidase